MADVSKIEWTDATWNPWQGCHKVSPGCKHCYMYQEKKRYGQNPKVVVRSKTTFNAPLSRTWARKWKEDPKKNLVFTCSWSDFFIPEADGWRDEAWKIIQKTPHYQYQILTKRPERMAQCLPNPLPSNVWLGVSVENPDYLGRIDILRKTPAAVRFLSLEPLLAPLPDLDLTGIDWVIVGGESGPSSRPMHADWVREIRDRCVAEGVPFFFKQWGGAHKAKNGRVIDGRTWDEMPTPRTEPESVKLPVVAEAELVGNTLTVVLRITLPERS